MNIWRLYPELSNKLSELWAAGVSTADIAAQLGHDLNRNAVVGKAARLGLGEHPTSQCLRAKRLTRQGVERRVYRARKSTRIASNFQSRVSLPPSMPEPRKSLTEFDAAIPLEQRRTLLNLGLHQCHWIVGDPQDLGFNDTRAYYCGGKTDDDKSYCSFHHRVCYTPPPVRVKQTPSYGHKSEL